MNRNQQRKYSQDVHKRPKSEGKRKPKGVVSEQDEISNPYGSDELSTLSTIPTKITKSIFILKMIACFCDSKPIQ